MYSVSSWQYGARVRNLLQVQDNELNSGLDATDEEVDPDKEVDPDEALKVLLVTYMRGGSTFLGSMLRVSQTQHKHERMMAFTSVSVPTTRRSSAHQKAQCS